MLLVVGALAAAGCGGDGAESAESAPPTPPKQQARVPVAANPCPPQVNDFLDSLDSLRRQLAVGLSYEQYVAKVKDLRADYDEIPIGRLSIGCLRAAGSPTEDALNKYIDGANAWGECLAAADCTTAAIEPVLQRKWRLASRFLSEAQ